jgi:DNA modification methylase
MGLPAKQLFAVPWRLALALQADGWWLRSDIIWSKPGVMPESVKDRPTRAHEYVFLLTKSARYYYDYEAIKEPIALCTAQDRVDTGRFRKDRGYPGYQHSAGSGRLGSADTRNKRSVWTIPTHPFKQAHFATFPPRLVETCLKAGCPIGGTVLDPFAGSGTTGLVAAKLGRLFIGIERSSQYAAMAERRIHDNAGLLALAEG